MTDKKQNFDVLDLTKFLLALLVIAIHCNLEPEKLYPWLRIAVPIFFTIGSYLFFKKISQKSPDEKLSDLVRFVKRNIILYAVWTLILFPLTAYVREYEWSSECVQWVFRQFYRGDGFLASWYIMASVVATVIVYLLSLKVNIYILLGITLFTNIFCCFVSGYMHIMPTVHEISDFLDPFIGNMRQNFVVALFWITLGKAFADGKLKLPPIVSLVGIAVSAYFLDWEAEYTILKYQSEWSRDCYFMLIPLCFFIFAFILSLDSIRIPGALFLRKSSTVMYVTHYTVIRTLLKFGEYVNDDKFAWLAFCVTVPITLVLCVLIIRLSEFRRFSFLKNLY